MISSILFLTLATGAARAALVPTAPGPGQVFNAGGDCTLSWNLDTSGKWTSFNVDLMSGSNLAMQTVTNVFKGRDGTKGEAKFTWKCPEVTPNSAIYFYQFTQSGADTTWTTRFAIASASGQVTPPANSTQPGGEAIPWGIGHLAGAAASTTPEPTVTPSPGSNTAALTTPPPPSNSSNLTSGVSGGSNSPTGMNNTAGTGVTSPPKQSTSSPTSSSTTPSSNKGSSPTNTASTQNTNTTPSSTSDAPLLMISKAAITIVALITLSIAA